MMAMNREQQRAELAQLVQRAKDVGLKVRWCDTEIVVLGLPPDAETEISHQQIHVPDREERRGDEGPEQGAGPGEDEEGG
jgi:hypothetical protein